MIDPDTQEKILSGLYGPISASFRFERRDDFGTPKGDISNAFQRGGNITLDNTRVTLRTAQFLIDGAQFPTDWDYNEDFVQPYMDVQAPAPFNEVISFPLGLYQLSYPVEEIHPNTWRGAISAVDLTDRLARKKLDDVYPIPAGSVYSTELRVLLDDAGLRHNLATLPSVTSIAFAWDIGATRREIAEELARGVNAYPVWPDENGVFQLTSRFRSNMYSGEDVHYRQIVNLGAAFNATYNMLEEPSMVQGRPRRTRDVNSPTNTVKLIFTDPSAAIGLAGGGYIQVTNNDLSSPVNAQTTELRTFQNAEVDRVALDLLTDWGLYEIANQASMAERLAFETKLDPRRTGHEYYRIVGPDPINDAVWKVISWTLPLDIDQPMRHVVSRTSLLKLDRIGIL